MPTPSEILLTLVRIANGWLWVAAAWHFVLAGVLLALARRWWRPSTRSAALATLTPIASVSVFSWIGRSPFNGCVFGIATVALASIALRWGDVRLRDGAPWERWTGAALVAFGWFYPHFLDGREVWLYALASPLGLVPCPTLSVVIGASLWFSAFGSRAWGIATGALGVFYGLFGVARLGVWLDLPLLAGGAIAIVTSLHRRGRAFGVEVRSA